VTEAPPAAPAAPSAVTAVPYATVARVLPLMQQSPRESVAFIENKKTVSFENNVENNISTTSLDNLMDINDINDIKTSE
jgi:hypothetical protein